MSGILTYEENMPTPNVRAAVEFDHFDLVHIESYMTQLHLRKHLNQLHTMFYKPEESEGECKKTIDTLRTDTVDQNHKLRIPRTFEQSKLWKRTWRASNNP